MASLGSSLRLAVLIVGLLVSPATSQSFGVVQNDIIVLDTDRLFNESRFGQRMIADYQRQREALIARNREIEEQLKAEERDLTEKRGTMPADEFRDLADAFDEKVQGFRERAERKARDLERRRERAPVSFMRTIEPVLVELMRDSDSDIILEKRQLLLATDVIDVTDLAISRVDEALGEGPPDVEGPAGEAPEAGEEDPGED